MKTLFHIPPEQESSAASTLLLELGSDYCCYAFLNKTAGSISGLKYFVVDEFELESALSSVLAEIDRQDFEEVLVCPAFSSALLTPSSFTGEAAALVELIYDQPLQQHLSDTINEWQMTNAYSLPAGLFEMINNRFPEARFLHAYTPALKVYNGFTAEDQIAIHFTTHYFRVLVKKGSAVQLAQMYTYKTPLDIVYYLLKICSELNINQEEVYIILSGLVEEASAVYSELHTYFLHLHFAQAPDLTFHGHSYPQHFFTSIYNLAACVS